MTASQESREANVLLMLSLLHLNMRMQMKFPMKPIIVTTEIITPTTQNSTLEFMSDISLIFLAIIYLTIIFPFTSTYLQPTNN